MSRITFFLLLIGACGAALNLSACSPSDTRAAGGEDLPVATEAALEADPPQGRVVYINGLRVPEADLHVYEQRYQVQVQPGRYWYDPISGLWGMEGGSAMGQILPQLQLGGPLQAHASGGTSEVFFNGRRLNAQEIAFLQQFTPVYPGRYWLDPYGNVGLEGGPMLANLVQLAAATGQRSGGGGSSFYRNGYTDIGGGSDGRTSYVIGKDFSVIVGD
ncbi:MAG: hypothetical protein D6722_07575 [Bacteroidetes bacterium]|nr:MAG: hypothetical protein D6722_07575 [Bacteroidota bacterium]